VITASSCHSSCTRSGMADLVHLIVLRKMPMGTIKGRVRFILIEERSLHHCEIVYRRIGVAPTFCQLFVLHFTCKLTFRLASCVRQWQSSKTCLNTWAIFTRASSPVQPSIMVGVDLSSLQLTGLGAIAVFVYLSGLLIYRLYFSPISKFPGPKIAALTLW
jgi:hypothetical protein